MKNIIEAPKGRGKKVVPEREHGFVLHKKASHRHLDQDQKSRDLLIKEEKEAIKLAKIIQKKQSTKYAKLKFISKTLMTIKKLVEADKFDEARKCLKIVKEAYTDFLRS